MDPGDSALFDKFMPARQSEGLPSLDSNDNGDSKLTGVNLADLILERIEAHEAEQQDQGAVQGGGPPEEAIELPAKVVEVYSKYSPLLTQAKTM